jgi:hypothetical protein
LVRSSRTRIAKSRMDLSSKRKTHDWSSADYWSTEYE